MDFKQLPLNGGDTQLDMEDGPNKGAVKVATAGGDGIVSSEQTLLLIKTAVEALAAETVVGVTVSHTVGTHAAADETVIHAATPGKIARVHRFDVVMGSLDGTVSIKDTDDTVLWSLPLEAGAAADIGFGPGLALALAAASGKGIKLVSNQALDFNIASSIEE